MQLREQYEQYRGLGLQVAGVVGQDPAPVAAFLESQGIPFPILPDPARTVIRQYGVYQLLGLDAFNMARPSSFLIDSSGVIRFLYVGSNQFDRPAPEVLLAEASKLV